MIPLRDPRLSRIRWKDLTALSVKETIIENTLTLPWLAASWILAYYRLYLFALPVSFIFFLTALRQAHNGFHYTLGITRRLTELSLFVNSVLMLSAMHAIKFNHLKHHKYCLKEGDVEGNWARMSAVKAVLFGPLFIFRQHAAALRCAPRPFRRLIGFELAAILLFVASAWIFDIRILEYHTLAMAGGEMLSGFFAVWTVHHDCDEEVFARTLTTRWKNKLTYNMFYHLEHHLFPGVPTIKLPQLSARIREGVPDLKTKEVF
jgi:fatty acid desaturase